MKIKHIFTLIIIVVLLFPATAAIAQNSKNDTPWLAGVTTSPHHSKLSPVVPMQINLSDGNPIPATLTEDIPISVVAETELFNPDPPTKAGNTEIPNPVWMHPVSISWYFVDWEKNKNSLASSDQPHAVNEMVITPLSPTGKAAITCYASRKMRYDLPEPGKTEGSFANSSVAKDVRVLDITPPTCGLEITVENGQSGAFWVTESPPNKYPPPKLADVLFTGALANESAPSTIIPVQGLELGENMIIQPDQAAIHVPANAVLILRVNGGDNYKLDNNKLKYGICNGAGGNPVPIGEVNPDKLDLSKVKLEKKTYLYVDASDTTGNREVLFVPLIVK